MKTMRRLFLLLALVPLAIGCTGNTQVAACKAGCGLVQVGVGGYLCTQIPEDMPDERTLCQDGVPQLDPICISLCENEVGG